MVVVVLLLAMRMVVDVFFFCDVGVYVVVFVGGGELCYGEVAGIVEVEDCCSQRSRWCRADTQILVWYSANITFVSC